MIRAVELLPSRRTAPPRTPSSRVREHTAPTIATSPRCACGKGASSKPTTLVIGLLISSLREARCGPAPGAAPHARNAASRRKSGRASGLATSFRLHREHVDHPRLDLLGRRADLVDRDHEPGQAA